jgi:hypothetical protein
MDQREQARDGCRLPRIHTALTPIAVGRERHG